tara:strand:- start:53 stop:292 length:240 start_codon:yes stop_codon:yes gene_type:complete
MGRAIAMERDIEKLRKDIDQLKSAFEGLAATVETLQGTAPAKKHVDLDDFEPDVDELSDSKNVRAEGNIEETEVEEAEA